MNFNPFDETTWQYADPNKILVINNQKCLKLFCLKDSSKYLYESDLRKLYDEYFELNPEKKDNELTLQFFLYFYIKREEKKILPEYIKTIKNVSISKYIYEIIKNYSKANKEIIADCFEKYGNTSQKELQRELRYSDIKHAYTISRIYFAEKNQDNYELDSAFCDYYQRKDIYNRKDYFSILEKSTYLQDNPDSLFFIKYRKLRENSPIFT